MTDSELLELAAKAVGKTGIYRNDTISPEGFYCYPDDAFWNPLTDDGDRYRLARTLKLAIDFAEGFIVLPDYSAHGFNLEDEEDEARAILRAAAEIGKAMSLE